MAENHLSLKIFLRDDNKNEARRVSVDASVATSYIFMKEKFETVFPNLRNTQFSITWKDNDGDEITIANDEDFITAFTEMPGNVKVLTIRMLQGSAKPAAHAYFTSEELPRPVVVCDACDRTITGVRYKCLQCPDFDLCADCEFQGSHSNHVMVRLPNNESYSPRCARKFMHHIARNLKKSAYMASKEAHRATKHGKHSGKCKQSENPGTSSDETEKEPSQNCPFNLKDIHTLGALAKENLTQLLEAIPTNSQTQTEPEKNEQGAMLFDVLRNAVDTFFGHGAQNKPEPTNSEKPSKASSENGSAPMDTDPSPSAPVPLYPRVADIASAESNVEVPTQKNGKIDEPASQPQWTFVAANPPQPQASVPEASQESQPKVAFIYHENPVIAEGLVKLHEMGFSNETGVLSNLLEYFNGNVADVVKAIFDKKI